MSAIDKKTEPGAPRIWARRGFGVAAALLVYLLLGGAEGLSHDARIVAAVGTLMALWWMTEAVPLSATALLPIILISGLTEQTVAETTAPYANSIVFLFFGGFLIAIAMEKWNLHRRIALLTLSRVGVQPRQIILGLMLATCFLSMWVSNTATTLMMLPIGLSVLNLVVEKNTDQTSASMEGRGKISELVQDEDVRAFGICLVLSIAWSASMGGLGTLLGSTPNAIIAGYAADELGRNIGFFEWMIMGVPLAFGFVFIAWWLMTRLLYRFDLKEISGGREMIEDQIAELGAMSKGEKAVLLIFMSAAILWVVPGLLANIPTVSNAVPWLGNLDDSAIAVAAGLAMFLVPGNDRSEMLLNWKDAEDNLPWGVLLLFGGGLSLSASVAGTGLDEWIGTQVQIIGFMPTLMLVAVITTLILFLTEVTSNTATAATFIPILGGVAIGIDADVMTLLVPTALAATCAFMLPVGTPPNAIVFGSGKVTISEMAHGGLVLNIVGIILITTCCYFIGSFALGLQF